MASLLSDLYKENDINRKLRIISKNNGYAKVAFNLPLPIAKQSLRHYNRVYGGFFARLVARVSIFFIG